MYELKLGWSVCHDLITNDNADSICDHLKMPLGQDIPVTGGTSTTLTTRFAAIQLKMLHLQFRMKKIYQDQKMLSEIQHTTNRDRIRGLLPAAYSFLDMVVSLDHASQLVRDIFATPELRIHLDRDTLEILNRTMKTAEKWRPVRNCLGGHIDIDVIEYLCRKHGYRGVFLSNDLECDVAVLNMLLLESGVNSVRSKSDIIGRDLDMRSDLASETKTLVEAINNDWRTVFDYFKPLMELIYRVGKQEKIAATDPGQRTGIVTGN